MNLLQFNAEFRWRSNHRYRRQRQRSWRYNPRWGLTWICRFVMLLTVTLFVALVHLLSYWEQMPLVLGCSSEAANAHCEPSVPVARWMPSERWMPSKGGAGLSWFSVSPVQYAYSTVGGSRALIACYAFRTKGWCFVSASPYPLKLARSLSFLSFLEFAHFIHATFAPLRWCDKHSEGVSRWSTSGLVSWGSRPYFGKMAKV